MHTPALPVVSCLLLAGCPDSPVATPAPPAAAEPAADALTPAGPAAAVPAAPAPAAPASAAPARPVVDHFYSDLDGTLLSEHDELQADSVAALRRFQAAGGKVGVATGRLPEKALALAQAAGADLPLIFGNGAVILDPSGKLIRLLGIVDAEDVRRVCARIEAAGCKTVYTAYGDPRTGESRIVRDTCAPADKASYQVVKVRARHCPDVPALMAALDKGLTGTYGIVESGTGEWHGVSVAAEGVGKDKAFEHVSRRLGVDLKRFAFCGDSGNDVAAARLIHERGGRCFVMDNGTGPLKAACPHHTKRSNRQGGVAEAVETLLAGR